MDRGAIAREGRRGQALDALQFERDRESALREQIAEIVLEQEGAGVDDEAFAHLSPEDVRRVRQALGEAAEPGDDALDEGFPAFAEEPGGDGVEEELARLVLEIEESQARQAALERYVLALGEDGPRPKPAAMPRSHASGG
jgi:hypothetical protein